MIKSALLLIDLQNEVLHPDGHLAGDLRDVAESLVDAARRLVGWARELKVPIVWVRMAFRSDYVDAPRSVRESSANGDAILVDGTWGAELVDNVGWRDDDIVITKKRTSAFFQTHLDLVLRGLGIEQVIVAGTSTNWAVESTVRDGDSLGYRMIVVREATGSRIGKLHGPALRNMESRYARIKSLAEVLVSRGD